MTKPTSDAVDMAVNNQLGTRLVPNMIKSREPGERRKRALLDEDPEDGPRSTGDDDLTTPLDKLFR